MAIYIIEDMVCMHTMEAAASMSLQMKLVFPMTALRAAREVAAAVPSLLVSRGSMWYM